MKTMILSLILLAATNVFAAQPNAETARVTKVLLHLPQIVAQLNTQNTDALTDIVFTEVKPGVIDYVLTFKRSCFCIENTATVTVNEDLRPTFADGAPLYTGKVTFSGR